MSEGEFGWRIGTDELVSAAMSAMASARREYGEFLGIVAELVNRGAAVELGYGTVEKLVAELVRVGRGEATKIVARASVLHDQVGVSGAVTSAALPATAAAVAEGAVSVEHLDRIREFHDQLPADVDPESWKIAETALATIARTVPPRGLCRPIEELRARLDPDGREPNDEELAQPLRELHLTWHGERLKFSGSVDREAGLMLEAALSPLSAPRSVNDETSDVRTVGERYGDALIDLTEAALRAQTVPGEGGGPVTILLTMDAERLRTEIGIATTMDGQQIPAAQLRRMACDAGIIPTVLGAAGEVLDMGNRTRTAPSSIRNRLIVRDGGCVFPGCTRPPAHCQAHHITHWADGGLTVPDNMALLCPHHHRVIHHSEWEIRMGDDHQPEFLPPRYLDPLRTPRRQTHVVDFWRRDTTRPRHRRWPTAHRPTAPCRAGDEGRAKIRRRWRLVLISSRRQLLRRKYLRALTGGRAIAWHRGGARRGGGAGSRGNGTAGRPGRRWTRGAALRALAAWTRWIGSRRTGGGSGRTWT